MGVVNTHCLRVQTSNTLRSLLSVNESHIPEIIHSHSTISSFPYPTPHSHTTISSFPFHYIFIPIPYPSFSYHYPHSYSTISSFPYPTPHSHTTILIPIPLYLHSHTLIPSASSKENGNVVSCDNIVRTCFMLQDNTYHDHTHFCINPRPLT